MLQQTDNIVGQPHRQSDSQEPSLMPSRAMGQEALDFLKEFSPPDYVPCFNHATIDQETFKGILQGTNFTAAVVRCLAACHWPPDVSKDYSRKDDWGISWLEMLFSFILFSNTYPPVKTGGQKADAIFWDWCCPRRPVLPQGFTLPFSRPFWPSKPSRWLISFLCLLRRSVRRSVISIYSGTFAGMPCRPSLPNPSETCQAVFSYISRLGGADSFYLPLNLLKTPVPFKVGPLQELPIAQRHQVWQRIVTRRYKQKARDRRNNSPAAN